MVSKSNPEKNEKSKCMVDVGYARPTFQVHVLPMDLSRVSSCLNVFF